MPKATTKHGLTSTLRPRNLDEEEKQRHGANQIRYFSDNLKGEAGRTTSKIEITQAGPDRRRVRLDSHRLGRASVHDLKNYRGPGLARPYPTLPHHPRRPYIGFKILLDALQFENISNRVEP